MVPENLKYTKEHEWAKINNNEAVFGITDHAQAEMGDITFVEIPEEGAPLEQSQPFSVVESVKAASDIYAPLSGNVVEVNEELKDAPELINISPYEKGWICKIKMSNTSEVSELMDAKAYADYLKSLKK